MFDNQHAFVFDRECKRNAKKLSALKKKRISFFLLLSEASRALFGHCLKRVSCRFDDTKQRQLLNSRNLQKSLCIQRQTKRETNQRNETNKILYLHFFKIFFKRKKKQSELFFSKKNKTKQTKIEKDLCSSETGRLIEK